jgi:thiol-disulfide isomerase/thioredoxin
MKKSMSIITAVFVITAISMPYPIHAMGNKQEESPPAASAPGDARSQEAGNSMMAAADPAKAVFDLSGMAPGVLPFSSEAAAQALAARRQVVYFFAASWCPTCRDTYRDLKANAGSIPENLVIVVVDYDKSAALKTKYGVTYQHTFILLGPAGEARRTWSGSKTIADIVKNASAS